MKFAPFQTCLFVEINRSVMRLLDVDQGTEWRLERDASGRLTDACKEALVAGLKSWSGRKVRWAARQVWCALGARGVSLRRLSLPHASEEELRRVLTLQIENEFPLPPEQLAWGYCHTHPSVKDATGRGQPLIVAAIKREALREYTEIFERAGLAPTYTLSALARSAALPLTGDIWAQLELGEHESELATIENGVLLSARAVPWALGQKMESLPEALGSRPVGRTLFLSGPAGSLNAARVFLGDRFGPELACEPLAVPDQPGASAATIGMKSWWSRGLSAPPLVLQRTDEAKPGRQTVPVQWQWAAAVVLALLFLVCLRYGEPLLCKKRLSKRLASVREYQRGLPAVDRELAFLQYLESNQPPMLDALYLLAKVAPGGLRLEAVSMNRRGDLALRGVFSSGQQATEYRTKLIDSGFFAAVVFDEQAPTPDRQRVTFRLSAQWKANGERPAISEPAGSKPGPAPATPPTARVPKPLASSIHAATH